MMSQKMDFAPYNSFFGPKRTTLSNRGHEMARHAAELTPTRKLKVSNVTSGYGGSYDPIVSVPSDKH